MGIPGITTDGAAADKGDKDKDRKYQQANRDIVVHPASLETYGRLSQRFHSLLIELDALATQHATARGLHAARFYRRWLTLINVALNKCLCRVFEETVCPHTKSIQDPLSTVSHKHLTAPNPNREDPPPPDLHLASPRHIPTRLRQRSFVERPSHQPPTPTEYLGESSEASSSAPTSPRSGIVTPDRPTTQNYAIHSDIDSCSNKSETQKATNDDLLLMYTQHPPAYSSSMTDSFFSHPFEFGAPPFGNFSPNTTLLTPNSTHFKSQPGVRPPSLDTTSLLTNHLNHAPQSAFYSDFEPDFGATPIPYSDDVFDITAPPPNHDGIAIITTQTDGTHPSRTSSCSSEPHGVDE